MKLLLDTHAFIWLNTQPSRLSSNVMGLLTSGLHDIYLSIASPWEMQIKSQLGKLSLDVSLSELISTHVKVCLHFPFTLSLSKCWLLMVRQAHHKR